MIRRLHRTDFFAIFVQLNNGVIFSEEAALPIDLILEEQDFPSSLAVCRFFQVSHEIILEGCTLSDPLAHGLLVIGGQYVR